MIIVSVRFLSRKQMRFILDELRRLNGKKLEQDVAQAIASRFEGVFKKNQARVHPGLIFDVLLRESRKAQTVMANHKTPEEVSGSKNPVLKMLFGRKGPPEKTKRHSPVAKAKRRLKAVRRK